MAQDYDRAVLDYAALVGGVVKEYRSGCALVDVHALNDIGANKARARVQDIYATVLADLFNHIVNHFA